ncbi:MAG TPA: GNA1162 family protein [bacterium]
MNLKKHLLILIMASLLSCYTRVYRDINMDFGVVRTVVVMPLVNLSSNQMAAERVRDVFITMLLAASELYVLPPGEVARSISMAGIQNPTAPTAADIIKLGNITKADTVITGTVKEYGEVRSGTATSNVISISIQMAETQTGRVVWSASTTRGGIGITDRLFGGGGKPMNDITEKAINDLIHELF